MTDIDSKKRKKIELQVGVLWVDTGHCGRIKKRNLLKQKKYHLVIQSHWKT